jgi:L-arabinokinase
VLARERDIRFPGGVRILICSTVPEGKGVSSSAALEVAVMQAVAAAFDIDLQPSEMALLCQKVENLVVGAPCGVMDQMTAACGQANRLLALLCQPAELQGMRAIPDEAAVWGLDSGERHSVAGADYGSVRVGAFMGYRIIAELAGLHAETDPATGLTRIEDPKWQGYLANISPADFDRDHRDRLPRELSGADFLAAYGGTTDPVTRVDPVRTYAVLAPTAHPIYEHSRVSQFAELLAQPATDENLACLGGLMYESHASYSACGIGSKGTDLLVELVRQAGPGRGLYGAKITGGGSGGTVAVLGRRGSDEAIFDIARNYERQTGHRPFVFAGSSPGAVEFGHLELKPE